MPMRGIPVAKDVEAWMARLPPAQRATLQKLREQIHAAAPGTEETISYGMPTFTLHGHLVAFGAFKKHLSFFPMSSSLIQKIPEAREFATSTGTMQFQPDRPIPAALIKKIVQARLAQNLEIVAERARKAGAKKLAGAMPRPSPKKTAPPKPRAPAKKKA